jgi:Cu-processing system permease protein
MSMTVFAIARDQLADLWHRRLILALLLAAVLLVLVLSLFLIGMNKLSSIGGLPGATGKMSEEDRLQFAIASEAGALGVQTALYGLASLVGAILSLVMFCSLISSERARGSLPWVLSRPISRGQFLLGRWLGASAMVLIYTAIMSMVILGSTWFLEGSIEARVSYACLLMFFKFLLIGSVGAFLAMVMPPALGGVVAYFAGARLLQSMAQWLVSWAWLQAPLKALSYVAPSYSEFNAYHHFLLGVEMAPQRVVVLAAYAVVYSALMIVFAVALLGRRDLA